MKKILCVAIWLMVTALPGPAGAGEVSSASVDRLLEQTGIHGMVAQFPRMLHAGMAQARQRDRFIHGQSSMSDEDYRALESTVADAFDPAAILRAIAGEVRRSLSEQDARRMLAWYDSPLGQRISRAEDAGASSEDARAMAKAIQSLMADKKRVLFAMKLDKLLHMTDMSTQFRANAKVAMLVAFSTKKNAHRPANMKALRKRVEAGLQKKRYRIRQSVIRSTVYTYRNVDLKDLAQYRAFLQTPAAMRFNRALMTGMDTGMSRAIDRMARSLERLMKDRRMQKAQAGRADDGKG